MGENKAAREARLAAALRQNLRRRKAQTARTEREEAGQREPTPPPPGEGAQE